MVYDLPTNSFDCNVNIKIDDINPTRKALVATVSADEIEQEYNSLVREFSKMAKVPGFRPGKTPAPVIEQRFAPRIKEELDKKVTSEAYKNAVKESNVDVFQLIEVKKDPVERGGDREITFMVDIQPEIPIPEYKGIPVETVNAEVTDEDVEKAIAEIRNQRAEYTTVEREVAEGDYVKLSYEGRVGEQPVAEIVPDRAIYGKQASTWEEVSSETEAIPGLSSGLTGLKAGDKKDIPISFPSDFKEKELAGKAAVYSVEVFEVREKKLPELNEEFLKQLQVNSLDELKEQIRQEMARRKETEGKNRQRQQVGETLVSRVEFPIPETAIEAETQQALKHHVERSVRMGVPPEMLEEKKEEIYHGAKKAAVMRVKLNSLLLKIAEKEKITVEDDDIRQHIMREAMMSGAKPDKVVKELKQDENRVRAMHQTILFDKTLDFLVDQASVS